MKGELRDTFNVEVDGNDIEFEFTYELGEPETRDYPGTSISIDIKHAWMHLADAKGGTQKVDVMGLLDMDFDYDWTELEIIDYIKDQEPDPDVYRDDF
jgi:hypothetical protein